MRPHAVDVSDDDTTWSGDGLSTGSLEMLGQASSRGSIEKLAKDEVSTLKSPMGAFTLWFLGFESAARPLGRPTEPDGARASTDTAGSLPARVLPGRILPGWRGAATATGRDDSRSSRREGRPRGRDRKRRRRLPPPHGAGGSYERASVELSFHDDVYGSLLCVVDTR